MNRSAHGFDRLARWYELLERLAFGGDLERARWCHLAHLEGCRHVLVLGEGDGRCLARIRELYPELRIDCVDASAGMLAKAQARLLSRERAGVSFLQADVATAGLGENCYDAVVTFFFLDCFTPATAEAIASKVRLATQKNARWLWADFAVPVAGWRRWRAKVWLGVLYRFFTWETGLSVRRLPPAEEILRAAGFRLLEERSFQARMVRSAVFAKED